MSNVIIDCRCGGEGDPIFGKEASHLWATYMQNAEGPKAFEFGYQKMLEKYVGDSSRTAYIEELYKDPNKAHFKRDLKFSNATLVDVCESLFAALKRWVFGSSRKSSSLLMAVVRIVEGSRLLILKNFLKDVRVTESKTIDRTQCRPVITLFKHCINHLTQWAVIKMYDLGDRSSRAFDLQLDPDTHVITVTRRYSGDVFVVKKDATCWDGDTGKQCWQQLHTGLLCKHAVLATIDRLAVCTDENKRNEICDTVISLCQKNWHRNTYTNTGLKKIPKPPTIRPYHRRTVETASEQFYIYRLKEVLPYVPSYVVEEMIHQLESHALLMRLPRPSSTDGTPTTITIDQPMNQFSNPGLRVQKRKSRVGTNSIQGPYLVTPNIE